MLSQVITLYENTEFAAHVRHAGSLNMQLLLNLPHYMCSSNGIIEPIPVVIKFLSALTALKPEALNARNKKKRKMSRIQPLDQTKAFKSANIK